MGKGKHGKVKTKNNKKKIIIVFILILLVSVGIGTIISLKNNGSIDLNILIHQDEKDEKVEIITIENQSEELKKEKEFLGLKFQNTAMKRENGITYFTTEIKNESNEQFKGQEVKLIFQNEDLSLLAEITTHIDRIEVGQTIKFEVSTSVDLINAYTFKIQ